MTKFYEYLLRAHEAQYGDDLLTFLDGFFAAAEAFGISCPFNLDNPIERQNWALTIIADANRKQLLSQRAGASLVLDNYTAFLRKETYRGMIFNRLGVNSDGHDVNECGEPIDEICYYNEATYRNKRTGEFLLREDYKDLPKKQQRDYIQVRYYEVPDTDCFAIYSNDTAMMSELIRRDILIGDTGVNQRYLSESRDYKSDLYQYRQVITDALEELSLRHTPLPYAAHFMGDQRPNNDGQSVDQSANPQTHTHNNDAPYDDAEDDKEDA